jgi:hypothetical protein
LRLSATAAKTCPDLLSRALVIASSFPAGKSVEIRIAGRVVYTVHRQNRLFRKEAEA